MIEDLRANMSIFLTEQTDKNVAKTVMEELLSQVEEFSGNFKVVPEKFTKIPNRLKLKIRENLNEYFI